MGRFTALIVFFASGVSAEVVYDFSATCTDGCTGTATGVLVLENSYVPGTPVESADFVSFTYSSSSGSFDFNNFLSLEALRWNDALLRIGRLRVECFVQIHTKSSRVVELIQKNAAANVAGDGTA